MSLQVNSQHITHPGGLFTFEGGVVTPEAGDEVPEQRHQNEAVLSVQPITRLLPTPAQVQSQGLREGGGDADRTLGFLLKHRKNKQHQ